MLADELRNPTKAALRAGYSKKSAPVQASKLMKKPAVQAILGKFQREREERTQITSDMVWQKLYQAIDFDPAIAYETTGDGWWIIKRLEDLPEWVRKLITDIQTDFHEVRVINGDEVVRVDIPIVKVKFVDKNHVISLLAKHCLPPPRQEVELHIQKSIHDQIADMGPLDVEYVDTSAMIQKALVDNEPS